MARSGRETTMKVKITAVLMFALASTAAAAETVTRKPGSIQRWV
jgi:hypothetical protein